MPRLDIRTKTALRASLSYSREGEDYENDVMISELSLSGALVDSQCHGPKDIITIKPEFPEFKGINIVGEVARKYYGKVAVMFHFTDQHTRTTLWEYIKAHLSNTKECPYCNAMNVYEIEYCANCKWLVNINDKDYLKKHDKETFMAKVQNRSGKLTAGQMQRVIYSMSPELLKKGNGSLLEGPQGNAKDIKKRMQSVEKIAETNLKYMPAFKESPTCNIHFQPIVSQHPNMVQILKLINEIANSGANILIQGESGTGKELIAHSLHYNSKRNDKPFVPINCGAIPDNLLESELFGHTKGAFTGAVKDKEGRFESAEGGTIFLDEVCEMSPSMQVKLLRILQNGEYNRVGSTTICRSNVRILAATNKDLLRHVEMGKFREDLYYRLGVLDIVLPPLRERKCDIPLLTRHFLDMYGIKHGKANLQLTPASNALLMSYDYPGNIRELENIIQRAVILAKSKSIDALHLPGTLHKTKTSITDVVPIKSFKVSKRKVIEQFERKYIINCLRATMGNISRASMKAEINVKNFYEKINKYGIEAQSFRESADIVESAGAKVKVSS